MDNNKTLYNEIVDINYIGKQINPIDMNSLLKKASKEKIPSNDTKVLVIGIDYQNDFISGSLSVKDANKDLERFTKFIYNNMSKISEIDVSIDTHIPQQIFHPLWWIDGEGNNPKPFTIIKLEDLDSGKWRGLDHLKSRDYVENLEKTGKKVLCIWPYHCLQGTWGAALENQFSNMLYFFNVAKKSFGQRLVKGLDPYSEMFGIIKPEYDTKNYINTDFLNKLKGFDKIIIGGEAKSHCVLESVRQILEHYEKRSDITSRIYILEDCMSSIDGFESETENIFNEFKSKYKIKIEKSDLIKL
ncbi:MAG: cysteine hydrolase family protein [Clostridiales bacterium]